MLKRWFPGHEIRVLNGGLNSATSAELLSHYLFRHRHLNPDIVVIHIGINDTAPLMLPDYTPDYGHYRTIFSRYPFRKRPFEEYWLKSAAVRTVYAWWLNDLIDARHVLGYASFTRYSPEDVLDFVRRNEPIGFQSNLSTLLSVIKKDGGVPILFPVVMAPLSLQKRMGYPASKYYEARSLAIKKNMTVMKALALEYGVKLVEIPQGAISDEDFLDHMHVNEHGEGVKAGLVASVLRPVLQAKLARLSPSYEKGANE